MSLGETGRGEMGTMKGVSIGEGGGEMGIGSTSNTFYLVIVVVVII